MCHALCKEGVFLRNISAALTCNKFPVVPPGSWIREVGLFWGLTIETVRDILSEVSQGTLTLYQSFMTRPYLACSSVSHNQGNGQIGPKRD